MATAAEPAGSGGARLFGRLARWIVRHPWHPVAVWVALLVVAVPFLPLLGGVTNGSADSTPSSAPSAVAAARFAELFPNDTGGSSTTVLLYGADATDPLAQTTVLAVADRVRTDARLTDVAAVSDVYSAYAAYLAGEAELAGAALAPALAATPSLPATVNATALLLWGPPAAFVAAWEAAVANHSAAPNPKAYHRTAANETGTALTVLQEFYAGFNGSANCAAQSVPAGVVACADAVNRAALEPNLTALLGSGASVGAATLAGVDLASFPVVWSTTQAVVEALLAAASGLSAGWIADVWAQFPSGTVAPGAAATWANATVDAATLATEPLPVPPALTSSYVNAAGTASIVQVTFSVADSYTTSSGADPVYNDLPTIDADVAAAVRSADPSGSLAYAESGPAPLDLLSQVAVNSSLSLVLPLTVGLLLGITMIYFRSPLAPLVTFGGLAIALVLGLGWTVAIGTLVEHLNSSALPVEEVFVLGVGTDYSIFLVARYREELVGGRSSEEAIVTSMSWAGQSVATSGSTAILVTVALAASGVTLLAQWGLVLSVAILITVLLSLTLVPAALTLIGPRILWPSTGVRFQRQATLTADRTARRATYFHRAARVSERHAGAVVAAILLVSVPLLALALTVPISYDYYGQLPNNQPATEGLAALDQQFGPGFATPSYALVTFASPLRSGNVTDAGEFVELANLTRLATATAGIAAVGSPVGPDGAPLAEWETLATLPPADRANLLGELAGYVGTDGRTVLITLQTTATGLSQAAVASVGAVQDAFTGYAADHAGITEIVYGGAAPVIRDLADETSVATEFMLLAVALGLFVVLVVVLRSWIIALLAIGSIGLSIGWAWALTYLLLDRLAGLPLFFYVRTFLIVLVLGLGIDYNIFLLTRVREERLRGRAAGAAASEAVARTGGIISAAAVILASAFGALIVSEFTLIRAIGLAVAVAVLLDAMIVRTYLVPATLHLLGDRAFGLSGRRPPPAGGTPPAAGS